jgi:hypothetical protein
MRRKSVKGTGHLGATDRVGSDPGDDSTQPLESPRHRGLTPINRITGVRPPTPG